MTVYNITYPLPEQFDRAREEDLFIHLFDYVVSSATHSKPEGSDLTLTMVIETQAATLQLAQCLEQFLGVPVSVDDFSCEDISDVNWLETCYKAFPPITVDRFFVYGSHFEGGLPKDKITLQIDASTAFGSGEHGTTAGCLELMAALDYAPQNILDMGTGSGILAIAAFKLWGRSVLAVDIDQDAVELTEVHNRLNGVSGDDVIAAQGDGFSAAIVEDRQPFDLVIANILAGPLKDMAGDLVACLADEAYVILSGTLIEQADDVCGVYETLGLKEIKRVERGEWAASLLQKS